MATLTKLIDAKQPRFRTATEYVESTLKEAILTGALPGGTPLRQEDLAAEFGLSRMPIREALRQLEAQALVDFYPHRGAVVTEISAAEGAVSAGPAAIALTASGETASELTTSATMRRAGMNAARAAIGTSSQNA